MTPPTFPIYWYLYKNSVFNFTHFSSARSQNFTYSVRLDVFHLFPKITVNHTISCIMRTGGWKRPRTTASRVEGDGKLLSNEFKLWTGMKYMNIMHAVWTIDNCISVKVGNVIFSSDSFIVVYAGATWNNWVYREFCWIFNVLLIAYRIYRKTVISN